MVKTIAPKILAAPVIAFEGGSEKGGGEGGERESKYVLALNAAMCMWFPLYLSFSYLRSAVAASLDMKKFHRNDTLIDRVIISKF
jgi:hypothetical protein